MNPGENNPSMNAGAGMTPGVAGAAGGDSPVPMTPSPLDLTNMGAPADSGLSMADSLASAQDSLTSAGMAAQTMQGSSIGMDQIAESAASATMEAPDEPLVPAAPVPGSIGSVTSVPPMDAGQTAGAGFAGATAGQPAEQPTAPYNPFATATAQSSSTSIPTALQPPVEKFSANGEGKKKVNVLTLLLGGLAVLFAVTTVIFVVLWQNALNGQKVVYLPPVSDTPVTDTVAMLTCTRETPATEGGFDGLQGTTNSIEANFKNDQLVALELVNGYNFENEESAGATREYFDNQVAAFGEMGAEMGMLPITAKFEIQGATVTETLTANADQLVGGYVSSFMLDDASVANGDIERINATYTGQGFSCSTE